MIFKVLKFWYQEQRQLRELTYHLDGLNTRIWKNCSGTIFQKQFGSTDMNTAQNKNFADAILLRLFQGSIYKIQNPDDETIDDTYRGNGRPYREGVWAREWTEMMLMEKEHNLWEF